MQLSLTQALPKRKTNEYFRPDPRLLAIGLTSLQTDFFKSLFDRGHLAPFGMHVHVWCRHK